MIWAVLSKNWPVVIGMLAVVGLVLLWQADRRAQFDAGYEQAQAENRKADFEQAKERIATDDAVEAMSDAELCRLLGGVFADGTCK